MVAAYAIHVLCSERDPAKNVPAADDDPHLNTFAGDCHNIGRKILHSIRVDAERLRAGHGLAAKFQKDSVVSRHRSFK
jgi:hypothetical protein